MNMRKAGKARKQREKAGAMMKLKAFYKEHERLILMAALILMFAVIYPAINRFSIGRDAGTIDMDIDDRIPFWPWVMPLYLSAFIMPLIVYFHVKDRDEFRRTALAFFVTLCAAYSVFLLYPIRITLVQSRPDTVFAPLYNIYCLIEPPYNALPSLHTALPLLAGLVSFRAGRRYWWMLAWALLIAVSTTLVKMHYAIDVLAGAALALLVYFLLIRRAGVKRFINRQGDR